MELTQLVSLLEAVRSGSFRSAAKALHLSQPSLSARIKALEHELRAPLFHRLGRGVRLTEMGETFLPFAERALELLNQGREAVDAARDAEGGLLDIASARTIGTYALPPILEEFRRRFPRIVTHIRTGRSTDVLHMVVGGEADLGLSRALNHPDVITIDLYDEEIVLVTHAHHPFALAGEATILEVAREPLILYDPGSSYFVLINQVCREAGIVPQVEMNLDSIEATKHMVAHGLGISFLPRSSITHEIERGMLAHISLVGEHRVVLSTCALVRRAQHYSPAVLAFLTVLRDMHGADISVIQSDLGV